MKVYGITDQGLVRRTNQDAYDFRLQQDSVFAVVCDGMGGAKAGNIASNVAVTSCMQVMELPADDPVLTMKAAISGANATIYGRALTDPECEGMGTTLVAVYVENDGYASIVNVGDSRAYHITPHTITRITRDHSLVEDLLVAGKITPDEARTHPNRNIITRALGTEADVPGDLYDVNLQPGEMILLCSDGLSNLMTDQEILFEAVDGGSPDTCCKRLLDVVISRGAPDNVTAVLICYDGKNE